MAKQVLETTETISDDNDQSCVPSDDADHMAPSLTINNTLSRILSEKGSIANDVTKSVPVSPRDPVNL